MWENVGWVVLGAVAGIGICAVWFAWYFKDVFR